MINNRLATNKKRNRVEAGIETSNVASKNGSKKLKIMPEKVKESLISDVSSMLAENSDNEGLNDGEDNCPICFCGVGENEKVVLAPCEHMMCDGCLDL